jgi:hypothetical protein
MNLEQCLFVCLLWALAGCGDGFTGIHRYGPQRDTVSAPTGDPTGTVFDCFDYVPEMEARARGLKGRPAHIADRSYRYVIAADGTPCSVHRLAFDGLGVCQDGNCVRP